MADDQVKDWGEWNRKWQRTITAQSPFEWSFAQKVIQKVSGLDPNHVTPQRSFIANDGRERHMDFAIEIDGVMIAIEVEGWDKTGENRGKNKREHDEFNRRIQSLTSQGWRVLTVTNAQFKRDPIQYIADINKIIFEEQAKLENKPIAEREVEEVEEVEEPKEPERTPNEERNVRPLYALVGLAAIVIIGVVIWAITRDSDTVVILDRIEETDRQDSAPDSSPPPTVKEAPAPTAQTAPESEVSEQTYLTKNRVDIRIYEDSQGDVDCGYLPPAVKPVWLPDPDNDPYNLDGGFGQQGNSWACGIPTYFTTDFDWDFEKWEKGGDVNCGDIPEDKKPIYLTDPEKDPYNLDGSGNNVDDGVACFPRDS